MEPDDGATSNLAQGTQHASCIKTERTAQYIFSWDAVVTYHLLCVGHVFKGSAVEIITFWAAHCSQEYA